MNSLPSIDHSSAQRRRLLVGGAAVAALAAAIAAAAIATAPVANAEPVVIQQPVQLPTFADVVEQVAPAVVAIRVRGERLLELGIPGFEDVPEGSPEERFFRGQELVPTESLGSGFFISGDGYIVTNNHVIDDANSFTVLLSDGSTYEARLVGRDELTDLALLKVDADRDFTYVNFSETPARVGDWAIAVGNPYGLTGTVTVGIVSGRDRRITGGAYDEYIQIDAAVNRGNSGGPSFNLAGEVIGVNTAIYSSTGGNIGIAFAVPAEVAADVVADLRDHGAVRRGWLGLRIQNIDTRLADLLGLADARGALVTVPIEGDPAAVAGVATRDVIIAINGETVEDTRDFARRIGNFEPGTEVTLTLLRDGATIELRVTLGTMPGNEMVVAEDRAPEERPEVGLGLVVGPNRAGEMVVTGLNPNGTAAAAGLREGDVIQAVDDTTVNDFDDLQAAIDGARAANHETMLFQIRREDSVIFVAVDTWVND